MHWKSSGLIGALLLAAGCAHRSAGGWPKDDSGESSPPPRPGPVIVTPAPALSGRISSVNANSRYVVISYPPGVALPVLEQRLNVYRAGLKVAEIKITGPSRDTNTIGDIISGECQSGDEVRAD